MKRWLIIGSLVLSIPLLWGAEQKTRVNCGTWITISAHPFEDYHFVRWSDGNADSVRHLQINENASYIAFFAANCEEYANLPILSKYDWLLMLNVRAVHEKGYYFGEQHVTWYRIVGEPDSLQGRFPQDDEVVCKGYYLTIDHNLWNTGDYYAVVDVSSSPQGVLCTGLMRSEIVQYTTTNQTPRLTLSPTYVAPNQPLTIRGLDPTVQTNIMVYDMVGKWIQSYTSQEQEEYQLVAAEAIGCYQVVVRTNSSVTTLRYMVHKP